jgi:hypothetical protein
MSFFSPPKAQKRQIQTPRRRIMTYAATRTNSSNNRNQSTTAPHRKNAALRSNSPYQQRTTERENPAQQLIKQAVDFLLKQLEEGKSEALTAYLGAMARFHNYSFLR